MHSASDRQSRTLLAALMTAAPLHGGRNAALRPPALPECDSAIHPSRLEAISTLAPRSLAEALSPRVHNPRALPTASCAEEESPDRRRWLVGLDSSREMRRDRTERLRTTRSPGPAEIGHIRSRLHWQTPGWDRVFPRPRIHERQERSTAPSCSRSPFAHPHLPQA